VIPRSRDISARAAYIARRASSISAGRSASVSPSVGMGSRTRTSTSFGPSRRAAMSDAGFSGEVTTGTSGAPEWIAITNAPFLNGSITPGSVPRVPSGKIQTPTRRARIASSASFSRPTACRVSLRSMRICPVASYSQPKRGTLTTSFLAMTTEPGPKACASTGTSSRLWWLLTKTHGRYAVSRSAPVTRTRSRSGGATQRATHRA
jgi:hypothetical protein